MTDDETKKPKPIKALSDDGLPVEKAAYEDLDISKIEEYIEKRKRKFKGEKDVPTEALLENIGVLVKHHERLVPSIAGLLLFGKDPQRFLWSSTANIARFKGTDMGGSVIDRKELRGTISEIIDGAEQFVVKHMNLGGMFEGLKRLDIPEYPIVAIREAITNAIVHRDYNFSQASVRVFMFDDRIEIYTPGGLPGPVTIENMEYTQYSRNRIIVEVLLLMGGYLEKLGTGIRRIKKATQENGLREPQFVETEIDFILTLFGPGDRISQIEKLNRVQRIQKIIKPFPEPQEAAAAETKNEEVKTKYKAKTQEKELISPGARWAMLKMAVLGIIIIMTLRSAIGHFQRRENPVIQYQVASELHAAKKYKEAMAKYRYFIKSFPRQQQAQNAQYYIGSCYEMLGMEGEAITEYKKVIQNYPLSDKAGYAQYWIATIYLKQGLLSKAIEEFHKLVSKYPDSPFLVEALYELAGCYQEQNNLQAAIEIYKKALDIKEGISDGFEHYQMGACFERLEQYKEAENMFRMVVLNRSAKAGWLTEAKKQLEGLEARSREEERIRMVKESLEEKKKASLEAAKKEVEEPEGKEEEKGAVLPAVEIGAKSREGAGEPEDEVGTVQQEDKEEIAKQQKIETFLKAAGDYFDNGQYQLAIDEWKEGLELDVFNTEAKEGIDRARAELDKIQKVRIEKDKENFILSGIIRRDDKMVAIVNGKVLKAGDFINGKEVMEIFSKSIILKGKDNRPIEIDLEKQ